ncbi:tyrosine-type recombinase/integrase [Thiohalorhabdus sp. Cl-TMA]|uniref:Tyrosine-type recombinase/integrase n=1 Tax=Thiohalorhabdus methylotrophus TaxID=3242694 RepID=A0ABV4TTL0_9GAMM
MAEKLTAKRMESLKPQSQRYEVTEPGGLGLRVTPKGTKSFFYFYKEDGRTRRLTLGTYKKPGDTKPTMSLSAARDALAAAKGQRAEGVDPAQAKAEAKAEKKRTPTVADFAETYLERWAKPNKKSWEEDERVLNREVVPRLGKLKLPEVERKDLVKLVDGIRARGAEVQANRTLAVVRRMMNFAVERGELEHSPATHIKQSREKARDRVLSREEIRLLFAELDSMNLWPATRDALELILRTAQRPGEVLNLEWADVDRERGQWIIPKEKAKNGEAHVVPLTEKALAILDQAAEVAGGSQWVFPASRGANHLSEYAMGQAMRRAINPAERPGKDADPEAEPIMDRATPHDLRRTAATLITEIGFNRLVVDKLLNHKDQTVGGVYDRHSYDKEKRQALEAWERDLGATFSGQGQGAAVVELANGLKGKASNA